MRRQPGFFRATADLCAGGVVAGVPEDTQRLQGSCIKNYRRNNRTGICFAGIGTTSAASAKTALDNGTAGIAANIPASPAVAASQAVAAAARACHIRSA